MKASVTIPLLAIVVCKAAHAQSSCTAVGHDRWTVKTEAPSHAAKAKVIPIADFAKLPPPATATSGKKGVKNSETRYSDAVDSKFHEGQLVSITGWVRFIKLSSDDCDYHIQVTPSLDNTDGMVIVEIPEGDAKHVSDASFRSIVDGVRAEMPTDLKLKKAPGTGGNKIGKAYMTFEGALFFDAPHHPNCEKRGVGMQAATCWEIHPVTAVRFAPLPK